MQPFGTELKQLREKHNLSLRQVADETRITLRHLESLEAGRYTDLPGGMYNRAFLRAYCEYLGVDSQPFLQRYDEETAPLGEKASKARVRHTPVHSEFRIPSVLVWSLMLLCSIAGLFFNRKWIAEVFSPYFSRPSAATAPPPPPAAAAPATAAVTASAAAEPPATAADGGPLRLQFEASQKCWVSVKSDGDRTTVALLDAGEARIFEAKDSLYVVLGNAGGVRASINGLSAKPFGKPGEVAKVLIDKENLPGLLQKPAMQ